MRTIIVILLLFGCVALEAPEQNNEKIHNNTTATSITVAAFNIQVFGISKASDGQVMEILAKTIRNFDIVAVQEIRDSSGTAISALLDKVNENGSYRLTVGPRLGRTTSKEQYAYFYNTEKVVLLNNYTYNDSEDQFHREPYIAEFRSGNFTFTIAAIHVDPDEAFQEIAALETVIESIPGDIIVMGDFNADCSYFDEMQDRPYQWLIGNDEDTTTKSTNCTYDRIVITKETDEYNGVSGVFRFDLEYGLDQKQAEAVSDHYPVYAGFFTYK
ncbi:endonuclease/exonuclease/phosphatase family protein [Candidatus Micrarchaeota archaeon]|nr:endonuclease/exonuclease/phosphatase family protein [Candidatus Micrarchaeota archaeon]